MPLADLTFLKSFTSNDATKITKYVNMFLNMAPQTILQMKEQLAAADWKSLRTSAHSLKSQLKYMGAASTVDIAYAIERNSADGTELDKVPGLVAHLEENTGLVIAELRQALTTL
jgi:HPt (histidine-containing phosphotransfer) domain-containing protein